tara:strand:- start:60884 stop:61513 length:630 start_codon:yes stop_codon:yes gene_type:complete
MKKTSESSKRWLAEHEKDPYVQEARKLGYRSRAAFKLEEIQKKDRLIKPGMRVVDLGAAPGGWSQLARKWVGKNGTVIAMDILPMDPIIGVEFIEGDFRDEAVLEQLLALVNNEPLDVIISDIAPNMSGSATIDQPRAMYLSDLAWDFVQQTLKPGGDFLIKMFQGEGFPDYLLQLKQAFTKVVSRKPKASRDRSREIYVLCKGYKGRA